MTEKDLQIAEDIALELAQELDIESIASLEEIAEMQTVAKFYSLTI